MLHPNHPGAGNGRISEDRGVEPGRFAAANSGSAIQFQPKSVVSVKFTSMSVPV